MPSIAKKRLKQESRELMKTNLDSSNTMNSKSQRQFGTLTTLVFLSFLIPGIISAYLKNESSQVSLIFKTGLVLITAIYCLNILIGVFRSRLKVDLRIAGVLSALLSIRLVIEALHGDLGIGLILNLGVTALILSALFLLRPKIQWFSIIGALAVVAALVSLFMAVFTPDVAYMTSASGAVRGVYKTISGNGLLSGPFVNANTLGVTMALSIPFVFLQRNSKLIFLSMGVIFVALWLSVARTSIFAAVLVVALYAVCRSQLFTFQLKRFLLLSVALVATCAVGVIPFTTSDPSFLTGRGQIWLQDIQGWLNSPLIGQGSAWHSDSEMVVAGSLTIAHTSSHNMLVGWLSFGGLLMVASCVLILGLVARGNLAHMSHGQWIPMLYLITLMSTGISEASWQVLSMEPSFYLYGYLMFGLIASWPLVIRTQSI